MCRSKHKNMDGGRMDQFLRTYEMELYSMQRPDKSVINTLTMRAADQIENDALSKGIVFTIERCIQQIQPHKKLIPLYVMDSIIKNVGGLYTRLMMHNLASIFSGAFNEVDNSMRVQLIKLLDTWQTQNVFSQETIDDIRNRLKVILQDPTPRPTAAVQPAYGGVGGGAAAGGYMGNQGVPAQGGAGDARPGLGGGSGGAVAG